MTYVIGKPCLKNHGKCVYLWIMKKSAPPTFELYPAEGAGGRQLLQLVAPGHACSRQAELVWGPQPD